MQTFSVLIIDNTRYNTTMVAQLISQKIQKQNIHE